MDSTIEPTDHIGLYVAGLLKDHLVDKQIGAEVYIDDDLRLKYFADDGSVDRAYQVHVNLIKIP